MKVGYQYFIISGSMFILMSLYLFFGANNSLTQNLNGIPTSAVTGLIFLWGIYRIYKGYKQFKSSKNEN